MRLMTWRAIFPGPYHVTWCHTCQETRISDAFDDVAAHLPLPLPRHTTPFNSRHEGSKCV